MLDRLLHNLSANQIARCNCNCNFNVVTTWMRCSQQRSFANSTPYDVKHCPIRAFAKQHPEAARQVLSVPSIAVLNSSNKVGDNPLLRSCGTLEQYLHWRGWDLDGIRKGHKLDYDEGMLQSAVGLLSHPLTFPLTLGRNIQAFFRQLDIIDNHHVDVLGENNRQLRLCCVGARAECTLPDDYWREFLVALYSRHHTGNNVHADKSFHCTIDFVGPDVPRNLKSKTLSLLGNENKPSQHVDCKVGYKLTMNYYTSFLHEVILRSRAGIIQSLSWDGYILFNPGFGHPNLQNQWGSTLQYLIETKMPILLTAHSTLDAERDSAVIEKLSPTNECDYGSSKSYSMNPYASRMQFMDPFPTSDKREEHIVKPNHYTLFLDS